MEITEKKPVKKRINSKAKGGAFEGRVAKSLSAALPINFIKSPGSGARIGGKNFATIGQMMGQDSMKLFNADVVPVNEDAAGYKFNFSVECKFYAVQDNFVGLANGKANLYKWFDESVIDSIKIDRKPILIFKWNNTPIYVAILSCNRDEGMQPAMTITHEGRTLEIFEFEKILPFTSFWVTKND